MLVARARPRPRASISEAGALGDRAARPSGHQHPAEVPVPDEDDVAVGERRATSASTVVRARADLLGRLAAGRAVVQIDQPGLLARISVGGAALVLAVVPFDEAVVDAVRAQARQLGRGRGRALRGLVSTSAGARPRSSRLPSSAVSRASVRPRSVSGMSVRLVCWPLADHSVSPCRSSTMRPGSDAGSWEATRRTLTRVPRIGPRQDDQSAPNRSGCGVGAGGGGSAGPRGAVRRRRGPAA